MPTTTSLLNALITHCRSGLPEGTTILQPGEASHVPPSTAWAEFWIDRLTTPISRRAAPAEVEFSLTINCFARPPVTAIAAANLAESISQCLANALVPLSTDHTAGHLIRLREPERRDLSRPATAKSAGLWHWSITLKGTAPNTND